MRYILTLIIFISFSTIALAGGEFFSSDWWSDDDWWWQEEQMVEPEIVPIPKPRSEPQYMPQQQMSIESIEERIKRLKRLLEEKESRRQKK